VAVGVDIGTTSAKLARFDDAGTMVDRRERRYGSSAPLDAVVAAALELVPRGEPAGLSAAMHSLVGLDARDRPMTPLLRWSDADPGAAAHARRLRAAHPELHARTGTPLYAMSPLAKLCRLREQGVRARRWAGVKEVVLHRLTGEWVMDHSTASGTGLMALDALDWDPLALELAGVEPDQLPRLVPATERLGDVVVGGGDGPLANLGLGAVEPGVAACSVGTSGAVRVALRAPEVGPGTFCYALTPGRWVAGAAISNGGAVLDWLAATLNRPAAELLELAAAAGARGLEFAPHLLPERAHDRPGELRGLRADHGPGDIARAGLEGIARELRAVVDVLPGRVREVRATGGLMRSPLFRELLGATLGVPLVYRGISEASAYGAALLVAAPPAAG
jgi:gluconokinase